MGTRMHGDEASSKKRESQDKKVNKTNRFQDRELGVYVEFGFFKE